MSDEQQTSLRELALLFLKLGTISFGGPAAHIAMMEDEVVRRRQWLGHDEFLDMLGVTNFIPGPNSTEMAIHVGYRQAGLAGLLVAGSCFILPAALIVGIIAWAYVRFGQLPQASGILYGVKPVVIAVVVQALWRLGRTALKTQFLAVAGVCAAAANALGGNELAVLFVASAAVALVEWAMYHKPSNSPSILAVGLPLFPVTQASVAGAVSAVSLWPLFLIFLKIGAVLFGSGYVLIAFLRADLVERMHWLTESQLLDAVAVGQITPGPVFTTATFIGYVLAGPKGAVVATIGIFLPAFFFVAVSGPVVRLLRKSPVAGAFLDGLNVASLGLMAVVTARLAHSALVDLTTIAVAFTSAILLMLFRTNSAWLMGASAIGGIVTASFR